MKLYKEDNEAIPSIVWSDTAPSGFTDISLDLIDLDKYAQGVIGYKRARDFIVSVVMTETAGLSGWGSYSQEEKDIAIKWICVPYSFRVVEVSEQVDSYNWANMIVKTKEGRREIIEVMRAYASTMYRTEDMTKDELDDFWNTTEKLFRGYIDANSDEFKKWLNNEVGSFYELDGFAQKPYFLTERRDKLIEIYQGKY